MKNIFLFFVFTILSNICFGQHDSTSINLPEIYKCWINSREEATQGSLSEIYRPCNYKEFPLSRFRDQIEFEDNGNCAYLYPAPDDGHFMVQGEWTFDRDKQILTIKDKAGQIVYNFKVISVSKDLLNFKNESR